MKIDFHVHTSYSHDCQVKIGRIIDKMRQAGMDGFAITDHNSFGIFEKEDLKFQDIMIIKGMEIYTEYGDLIGLFIDKGIKSTMFNEVVKEIREQGGISVLPHPYRAHTEVDIIARNVDVIEAFNGLTKPEANQKARSLARKLNKPVVAGSDAHTLGCIGVCYTEVDEPIRENILAGKTNIVEGYPSIGVRMTNSARKFKNMPRKKKIHYLKHPIKGIKKLF